MTDEAEALAQRFHETYERLAPSFGYETREASAKPWMQVPEQNRALMVAVCAEILTTLTAERDRLQREWAVYRTLNLELRGQLATVDAGWLAAEQELADVVEERDAALATLTAERDRLREELAEATRLLDLAGEGLNVRDEMIEEVEVERDAARATIADLTAQRDERNHPTCHLCDWPRPIDLDGHWHAVHLNAVDGLTADGAGTPEDSDG